MEDVILTDNNGNRVLGTVSIPEQAKSVVIISHGFSSSKNSRLYVQLQDELNRSGIGTFRYDYFGHGELYCKNEEYTLTSNVTLSKCVESLNAAISYVGNMGDYKIGLFGSSFGALVSLISASQNPAVSALALKSPVTEPIGFWKARLSPERIARWKADGIMHYDECGENFELEYGFWEDLQNYNTHKSAKDIACPILIIHGGSDTVVPIKQSYGLAKIVNTEVKIIDGADHDYGSPEQYNEMKGLVIDFFVEKLG